jgi:hypothetical protein
MFSPSSSSSSSSNDDDDDGRGLARPKLINRKADGGGGNKLQTPKIKINPPKQLQAILAQPPEVLVRQEQQLQSQIRNAPSRIRLVQGGHQRRVSGEDEEEGEVRDEALAIPISPESSDEQQPPFAPSSSNNIMGRNARFVFWCKNYTQTFCALYGPL